MLNNKKMIKRLLCLVLSFSMISASALLIVSTTSCDSNEKTVSELIDERRPTSEQTGQKFLLKSEAIDKAKPHVGMSLSNIHFNEESARLYEEDGYYPYYSVILIGWGSKYDSEGKTNIEHFNEHLYVYASCDKNDEKYGKVSSSKNDFKITK